MGTNKDALDERKIRVGTAGWNYKDWYGIFYPSQKQKGFQELSFLARFFDAVEVNSTFYRPPYFKVTQGWVKKVMANPDFKFTLKLWQRFTHERKEPFTVYEVNQFTEGIAPLFEAGRLGAVLIQFPWSFKNNQESREWLEKLIETFGDYPLVVEVRHGSWAQQAFYKFLEENSIGFANIDQPLINRSIKPSSIGVGEVGYVRLHGRNYKAWFAEGSDATNRYDYLYSEEELDPWVERIREIQAKVAEIYVITNNHPLGKAPCNALEIEAKLTGKKVKAPPTMVQSFPQLEKVTRIEPEEKREESEQTSLF